MADIKDLRDYVDTLDRLGDIRHIDKPIDSYLEAGATVRPRCSPA